MRCGEHCATAIQTSTTTGLFVPKSRISLGGRDDQNLTRFSLNFIHVALAYQWYSEDSHLLAENQHERQRRLKARTEVIGAVVSKFFVCLLGKWPNA